MPAKSSPEELRLSQLVRAHDRWRGREVFNLLPSENAVSPTARRYLGSDLAGRYTLPMVVEVGGETIDNSYAGTRYTDQIQLLADDAAARLFRAKFATTRPLSGHVAALSALGALLPRGSTILAISPDAGGYDGYAPDFLPAWLGLKVLPLPAGGPGRTVEVEAAIEAVRQARPAAVIFGQSFFLFPYPLAPVAEEVHRHGGLVLYDASHVLGLLAGGEFQDPLREGADVVYGSTHKSFPGPQGGLVLTDRADLFQRLDPALVWRAFDNAHWNRVAGVAQTLLELERVGPEYARATIANARALAAALDAASVPILARTQGYTASHQLHLDGPGVRERHGIGPGALARRWERSGLITDLVGRLGTAEVTRLGLRPGDMTRLADLLARSGVGGQKVRPDVRRWRREFHELYFT